MIIPIASSKAGTGKITIAVNLALSLPKGNVQMDDCDLEQLNSPLFLQPSIHQVCSMGEFKLRELMNPNATTVANVQRKKFLDHLLRLTNSRKEGSLCHTEWDPGDGDIIPMVTEEVVGGTPGGMADQFRHGGVQPRKRKFGFLKKKPISFEKT
jgi:hypothetical protein